SAGHGFSRARYICVYATLPTVARPALPPCAPKSAAPAAHPPQERQHMFSRSLRRLPGLLSGAMAVALAGNAPAEVTFSFEEADPLAASLISGDKASFATDSTHARTGSKSVRFVGGPPAPFESWTYDVPFAIT